MNMDSARHLHLGSVPRQRILWGAVQFPIFGLREIAVAEEDVLELVVLSRAGREALVDGRVRDAQVAACSNAMTCWTGLRSDDLWCGSRQRRQAKVAREVALLDRLQRGVGKCRLSADDWTVMQFLFHGWCRDVTRFRFHSGPCHMLHTYF